ncbi:DUF982 domain-containing protein [Rhizobium sp. XQZ8]|uniref:DUF982 domain-containing protein n=1 Tax=Rhizobium populisoli TaxID=2859785 RepID=UPI001C664998|nr:DUF982 domain-containing protein [Rhizobium populisoli]MBW6425473.1 DUF982 domain-containing protein [Rhizobium populisoli]
MNDKIWDQPVRVGDALIFSPIDAHRFLQSQWPDRKDMAFADAESAIRAALDGRVTVDEARVKFEKALKSAHLN